MSKTILSLVVGGLLLVLGLCAEAQQPAKVAKIGWLVGFSAASMASQRDEILRLLRELGYSRAKT